MGNVCAGKGQMNTKTANFMSAVYWQNMMRYTELYIDGGWRKASGSITFFRHRPRK